jgi:ferrochelatase
MPDSQDSGRPVNRGVILFNLGGPETLADVRPFLYNLFSDPEIIRIKNDLVRRSVAWLVAVLRRRKSEGLYRQIGGGSPLRRITDGQAAALSVRLAELGCPARVYVGMRCWKPTIDEAMESACRDGITHLVALPLFPQFSVTTTGSCFKYLRGLIECLNLASTMKIAFVENYFDDALYVESMADQVLKGMENFSDCDPAQVQLLYSAHSIPERYVAEGDPYLAQTQASVALINARLGNVSPHLLAFQSRVGPVKWLEPSTVSVLKQLGGSGHKRVLAIPISFVSDHIETLQEIDILYRQMASDAGIAAFHRAPSLNLYPKFIDALARIAVRSFA